MHARVTTAVGALTSRFPEGNLQRPDRRRRLVLLTLGALTLAGCGGADDRDYTLVVEGTVRCAATSCATGSGRFTLPGVGTPVDEDGDLVVVYDTGTRFENGLDGTMLDGMRVVVEGPGYWEGYPVSGDWSCRATVIRLAG
jgi:hypothetical protein